MATSMQKVDAGGDVEQALLLHRVDIVVHRSAGPAENCIAGGNQWRDVVVACLVGARMHYMNRRDRSRACLVVVDAAGTRSILGDQVYRLTYSAFRQCVQRNVRSPQWQ